MTGRRLSAAGWSQPSVFTRISVLSARAHPHCDLRRAGERGEGRVAAVFLKTGEQRLLRLARKGEIPSFRLGKRDIRFYAADLRKMRREAEVPA
jgi:hypothetical protein